MRYVELTQSERTTLEEGYKNHNKSHVRQRCQALLLSDEGWQVKQIAKLHHTRSRTIYTWMNRWQAIGLAGLMILPGRGVKSKLSTQDQVMVEKVKKKAIRHARSLKAMAHQLSEELGFEVTRHMLRRFLKRLGYSWKRFRKSLKKKQNQQEYEEKLAQLKQLIELYKADYIDLRFADESGFNLEGYVPYGWQPKGKYIEITPAKTKGTQIFGLMNTDNQLQCYGFKGSMTSAVVIACLEDFSTTITQPTVVVLDNAPIHHSEKFKAKIQAWKQQDLYIFFLPTYSPHLNPIEILWRKIKYEWIEYEDIQSQQRLDQKLEDILRGFGEKYQINFENKYQKVANIFA